MKETTMLGSRVCTAPAGTAVYDNPYSRSIHYLGRKETLLYYDRNYLRERESQFGESC
jgi:hypothetical protein